MRASNLMSLKTLDTYNVNVYILILAESQFDENPEAGLLFEAILSCYTLPTNKNLGLVF